MEQYKLCINAATSTGSREKNQDVFLADGFLSSSSITEDQFFTNEGFTDGQLHVFAVCDGVGMFPDSGPAAEAALSAIKERQIAFNEMTCDQTIDSVRKWVDDALIAARDALLKYCDEKQTKGSSTIALLAFLNDFYVMVNTGDSPVFLIEGDNIKELSVRHNVATLKRMLGAVPVKEEERILLHHLGEKELIYEEKYGILNKVGVFLICSDGVSNAFEEKELQKKLKEEKESPFFVSFAGKFPDADNCTSIIIRFNKTLD